MSAPRSNPRPHSHEVASPRSSVSSSYCHRAQTRPHEVNSFLAQAASSPGGRIDSLGNGFCRWNLVLLDSEPDPLPSLPRLHDPIRNGPAATTIAVPNTAT